MKISKIFIQSNIVAFNEIFLFKDFRKSNLVFNFLVKWRKVLHDLHSDFDLYVSHKNEPYLTASLLKFVF